MIDETKKAVSTIDLATTALGMLKSFAIVFAVVLIDWARKKQKLAENQAAVANTTLSSKAKQDEIQKDADAKSPDDVINSFLDRK